MVSVARQPRYWFGKVKRADDFGDPIGFEFVDGRTRHGPWAIMTPASWAREGITRDGSMGTGIGQRYRLQPDGRWLKVEG